MDKYNLGPIVQKRQLLTTVILIFLIIQAPMIGIFIDNIISSFINGGSSLFNRFEVHLFVYVGYGVIIYFIYKKIKTFKNSRKISQIKSALRQVIVNNSSLHLKQGEIITGPSVRIEENETDLFLILRMPFGLSKDAFKNNKDLFENVFQYTIIKTTETQSDLIFHMKKAEKDLTTDYLYEQKDTVILGFDAYSEPIWWNPLNEPHLIVASASGGGKTVYLQSIVLQLKQITKNLIFVDFKGNEFGPLEDDGYKVHTDLEGVLDTLRAFNQGMKERAKELKLKRLRDYTELGLEPNYLIFDEYSELISMFPNTKEGKAEKQEFESLLGSICRLGRSAGYYVILSMQQPNASTLSTEIRDNMGKKVAIKGANSTVQTMIFGERVNEIDSNLDYGNHIINTGSGYEIITVPYYNSDFFEDMARI